MHWDGNGEEMKNTKVFRDVGCCLDQSKKASSSHRL